MSSRGGAFRCRECSAPVAKWVGRCPVCQAWNSLVEAPAATRARAVPGSATAVGPRPIGDVPAIEGAAVPTGMAELDRVLSGGLVSGSVTLLGGEPGIGKSTLLLQVVGAMAARGARALYVAAEESAAQVRARADRLGAVADGLWVVATAEVEAIVEHLADRPWDLLVVDSVQAVRVGDRSSPPGSVVQVRDSARIGWPRRPATPGWRRSSSATSPRTGRSPGPASSSTSSTPSSPSRATATTRCASSGR